LARLEGNSWPDCKRWMSQVSVAAARDASSRRRMSSNSQNATRGFPNLAAPSEVFHDARSKIRAARAVAHAFSLFAPRQKTLAIFAGLLLLPVAALAQVSYTGTAATQNFGSQAIGAASASRTFNFSVAAGTTVGSIGVVTQGAPNLDFAVAAGGTCTAKTYASATTCTANVTFTPKFAGGRMGAVVFFSEADNTGNVLGEVLIYGIGTGPQIAYSPGTAIAIAPVVNGAGLRSPIGLAVDGAGDLFVADGGNNRIVEVPAGGGAAIAIDPTVNGIGLNGPLGMAGGGAGDLFIADLNNNRVVEVPAGGGAAIAIGPTVSGGSLNAPSGVAVDGAGNLFIANLDCICVVEIPVGGGEAIEIGPVVNGVGLENPWGLAVDGMGNLFIADFNLVSPTQPAIGNRIVEVPAGGGAATAIDPTVNDEGLSYPWGVAVDGAGDLFIADEANGRVVEVPAGGGAATAIDPTVNSEGLSFPYGVAVDVAGDIFIADTYNNRAVELQRSQPPALNFPTATYEGSIDTTDGAQTAQVQNIGNAALTLTALSYPADFSEAGGDPNACTGSASLSPGLECDVPIEFTPEHSGALNENVTLTDNALNVTGTKQSIAVSGTGLPATALISPTPGTVLTGPSVTFTWTPGTGATEFDLWLGFNGAGSSDLYSSGVTTATSATVTGLQTKGIAIYARLYYEVAGVWHHLDYTYAEATSTAATMISPQQGTTLGVSGVMFNWTAGTLVANYALWLGTSGPGSSSLYASPLSAATSVTVPKLPANGVKVYARLFSEGSGGIQYVDYTYTAQ
jgi:sugar lactone lactonase YvrE